MTPEKFRTRRGVLVVRLKKKLGDGRTIVASNYTMRVVRAGRQYYFTLPSTKPEAAKMADDIDRYLDIPTHTVDEALKQFNPDKWAMRHPTARAATIGDVLDAHAKAEKSLGLEERTGSGYRGAMLIMFRQALAFRRKGKEPTDETVRAMSLDTLTPSLVSDFKLARVSKAGDNKAEVERKKRSANGVFRAVSSIFTEEARTHYAHLVLPADLDKTLASMAYKRTEKQRYRLPPAATIERVMTHAWMLRNGYTDESGKFVAPDRNAYLAWLLAAHAGLRKKEIGQAVREWVESGKTPRMWVRSTPDFVAKGKDEGFAEVEPWVVEEIITLAESPSLILSGNETERTGDVFRRLNAWLKERGLGASKGEKAVHGLRALCGSYWATTRGIFTAQKFLRHKTVDVTNDHYADVILDKTLHRYWKERPVWAVTDGDAVEVVTV
jgi:integrase